MKGYLKMSDILVDLHTHSDCSPDGKDRVGDMYKWACELGLKVYALTDHCECNFWEKAVDPDITDAMMYGAGEYAPRSISEQTELKSRFADKLKILTGIELGQPLQNIEKAEMIASDDRLDFIIGSLHMVKGHDDFYYLDYSKMTAEEVEKLLSAYFEEILAMCEWGRFDVLGHLTYPLRYITGEYGIDIELKKYEDIIQSIFRTLIEKGKGIEINTSGLRQKYALTFPQFEYIKLFRDMGGEIITVGSDAHCVKDLGAGICEGIELARQAGFEHIAYFVKHEPVFLKI